MMRALYSGVSGLKTHQTKMDVIGNNIANVNTVAYKAQSITFSELMYQTTQNASGPNALNGTAGVNARQIGLGVQSAAISTAIATPGNSQSTGNPFDIKITGGAFFVVNDGNNNYFTRDGSFYVDAVGNLAMSSTGYNVMGWKTDETTGNIKQDTVTALKIMSAENLTYPPEGTTKAYISGIVDKNDKNINSDAGKTMNLGFYDNLGYAYTAKISIHKTETDGEFYTQLDDIVDKDGNSITKYYKANKLSDMVSFGGTNIVKVSEAKNPVTIKNPDGTSTTATYDAAAVPPKYTITSYDSSGVAITNPPPEDVLASDVETWLQSKQGIDTNIAKLQKIFGQSFGANTEKGKIDLATGTVTITEKSVIGGVVKFNTDTGKFISVNGADSIKMDFNGSFVNTDGATVNLGNFFDIDIDMKDSTSTNNNGSATVGAVAGDKDGRGMGRKVGEMSGVSIQNNGMIYANYTNGQTRLLGQIAVAEFANASGLEKMGNNLYASTLNSGDFDGIGSDITGNSGSLTTGALEMSNVDLSGEFTEMITTQRGFQANSRIITVSDTLLEELVNLKR